MSVKYKPPVFKPLPGELTPSVIREAVLPVKVAGLRRALAACTELPELLNYKRTIDGLAAAARTIKHEIPEMVRDMNRLQKEAIFKMGDLLSAYNTRMSREFIMPDGSSARKGKFWVKGCKQKAVPSERYRVGQSLGLKKELIRDAIRLSRMEPSVRENVIADESITNLRKQCVHLAPKVNVSSPSYSDSMAVVMGSGYRATSTRGLSQVLACLKAIPLDAFDRLAPEERKAVKAKIVEAQELLDAMDERLNRRARTAA
jgi:hypothetical protein